MGQGVTGQENQSRCVQCGKQGTDHAPLNRCGACKTSRYCSKGCQHRTVHKPVCMAIQELEKQKAAEDAGDDLNTTFHCHFPKTAGWNDKTRRTEVRGKMPNSGKGSGGVMGYRLPGLCCVKEVATNSLTTGGVKKC